MDRITLRNRLTAVVALAVGLMFTALAVLPAQSAWQQDEAEWLIMLYMNAEDKTLEKSLLSDLQEAELVGSSEDLHIVAQVDRYAGGFEGNADFTTAKRFYVTQDSDTEVLNSTEVADLGEINMADAGPLQDFIEWAVESYPARNTMLIFSGHGAGWPGGFIDPAPGGKGPDEVFVADLFGTDGLWLMELDRALADSRAATGIEKFDIVGFDSCLMSQIEVHSTMAKHAEYAIASEGLEPGIGWAYSSFLGDLSADPQMPADELSRRVVDSYINEDMLLKDGVYAAALGLDVEKLRQTMMHNMTLSAVDLNKMTALIDALDQLAAALADVDQDIVAQARTYAQSFESPFGRQAGSPYIDLGHFAQWIEENAAGTRAAESAVVVRAALDEAVISERKGPGRPGATGISIFFPGPKVYATAKNYGYDQIAADFVSSSAWDEYLSTHYETGQRQNFRPARSRTTQDLAEELNLSPNATKALLGSIGSRSEEFGASRERVLEILSEKLGVEADDADSIYEAIQDLIRDVTDEAEVRQILQDEGGFPEDLIDFLSAVGALTPLDDAETVADLQSVLQQSLGFDAADAEEVAGLVDLLVSEGFSQAEIQSILVEEVGFTQEVVDYLTAINALVIDPWDVRIQSVESQSPLFIEPLELSDELVSVVRNDIADDVLVVSTVVEGQDLAYIGYKVGRFLPREGTIIWEEQNLLMPDDVRYVGGIPYPEWDGNSVELDFEWLPWLPAISDGERTVRTLLIPDGLDVDAGIITYMAEGIYRFADDGEERYAQLFFRDDVLTQVFGFAGAEQSGVGAPWEILPRPGDQFTVFDQTSELEEEWRLGETLTFGDSPLTMEWVEAPSGNYVIGVYAENLSGGYVEEFQSVFVVNEDSESNDGWTPYINRELGFALLYPDDPDVDKWSITEEDASVQFETDTMAVIMLVDTFPEATSETEANVAARAEAIRLLQDLDLTDLLIDDPFPADGNIDFEPILLGGYSGEATDFSFSEDDLNVVGTIIVVTPEPQRSFILIGASIADDETQMELNGQDFEGMLANIDLLYTADSNFTGTPPPLIAATLFEDSFTSPFSGLLDLTDNEEWGRAFYDRDLENYTIELEPFAGPIFDFYSSLVLPEDFIAEVQAIYSGSLENSFGVLFRVQDYDQFYSFQIGGHGHYLVEKVDGDEYTLLKDWTESPAIMFEEGAVNEMTVVANGSTYSLYVNDVELFSFTDDRFRGGSIGLLADNFDEEAGILLEFDDLVVGFPDEVEIPDAITILADDFSVVEGGLPNEEDISEWGLSYYDADDGTYRIRAMPPSFVFQYYYGLRLPEQFEAEVSTTFSGSSENSYGMLFQVEDWENFYLFHISSDGTFLVESAMGEEGATVIDWTETTSINRAEGEINRLRVEADGPDYSLFINGDQVASFSDDMHQGGSIGFFADNPGSDQEVEAIFDDLLVSHALYQDIQESGSAPAQDEGDGDGSEEDGQPVDTVEPYEFIDDFSDPGSGWTDMDERQDWGYVGYAPEEGIYYFDLEPDTFISEAYDDIALPMRFDITVSAAHLDNPENEYGLLFQVNDSGFYAFTISGIGEFALELLLDDEWYGLVDWTESSAINVGPGEVNELYVEADGGQYQLYVNGVEVASFYDDNLTDGSVGFFAGSWEEPMVVGVNELMIVAYE